MLDFQELLAAKLPDFEGKIAWLYLDTHKPPLATTAIGCAINLAESLTLPWQVNGAPATAADIRSDWNRVTSMPGGLQAIRYYVAGAPTLTDDAITAMVGKRFDVFTPELVAMFPDFMSWPVTAKAGTLDMAYGLGIGVEGPPASGLHKYHNFCAAAAAHDWATCSKECEMNATVTAYDARNEWLKEQFLLAAQAA